jgi:hypothetical protein
MLQIMGEQLQNQMFPFFLALILSSAQSDYYKTYH